MMRLSVDNGTAQGPRICAQKTEPPMDDGAPARDGGWDSEQQSFPPSDPNRYIGSPGFASVSVSLHPSLSYPPSSLLEFSNYMTDTQETHGMGRKEREVGRGQIHAWELTEQTEVRAAAQGVERTPTA